MSHDYLHSYLKHCLEHKVITVMNDYINNKNCSYPDMRFFSYLTSIKKKHAPFTPLLCLSSSTKESFCQKTMPLHNLKSNCCM